MKKILWLFFLLIIGCSKEDAAEKANITWEVYGQGISNRIQGGGYGNVYQVNLPWTSSFKTAETDNLGLFIWLNEPTLENDGLDSILLKINGDLILKKTKWIEAASIPPGMPLPDDTGLWSYVEGIEGKSYSALVPTAYP